MSENAEVVAPELEWFHSFFEDGLAAVRCASEEGARSRMAEMGGYVLSRPKPEAYTVVAGEPMKQNATLPYGENEY